MTLCLGVCIHRAKEHYQIIEKPCGFIASKKEKKKEYLEILGITREQSGKYECKAANEVSSADVKQVKVTVNYPPTITESKSNEATTGRKASLKCEASAVPAPDFEWYRDDTRFQGKPESTEGQSSLTVTNVTEEHYGNYTCVAANNLGMTNASLVLFSKYAEEGAHLGEPSQSFSRGKFENHSLTIKYKHMQKSEYHL
uniref:Ig-like domain-containing protein n=1 Tax=Capra hircus TaxID=9925 RepID=A0A8C2NBY2_CAPHI